MRLKSFKKRPGTLLDAYLDDGEHLGTIMTVNLPPAMKNVQAEFPNHIPVVIIARAQRIKHRSARQGRGNVGLWNDCHVEYPK